MQNIKRDSNVTFLRNVGLVGVNRFYRTTIPNGMRKLILNNDILKEKTQNKALCPNRKT
jgi:hypothetical protein